MIALTSIAPVHINGDIQQYAINSWNDLGMAVYSFNNKEEISLLGKSYKNVTFIESEDLSIIYGKAKIELKTLLNFAKNQNNKEICLINSDIILKKDFEILTKIKDRLPISATIVKRRDFANDINKSNVFESGIDVFFIHLNYINLIQGDNFTIGECYWDYEVPYSLLTNNVDVYLLKEPFAFHRLHNTQYSIQHWERLGRYFANLHNIKARNSIQVNNIVYNYIHDKVK